MSERRPSDYAARAQALDITQSFIIQAPAGSGKTELLTDRILALLAIVGKPEEILAITFTRKAASEMHARVLKKLRAGLDSACPASEHEKNSWQLARAALARNDSLGWDLLNHPARLKVRTIDAFCAQLVRAMPWMSSMGGMPAIADNPEKLYQQAARRLLEHVDAFECVQEVVRHMDIDLASVERLVIEMLARRDQWLPETADTRAAMAQLRASLQEAMEQKLVMLDNLMPLAYATELAPPARLAAACQAEAGMDLLAPLLDWRDARLACDIEALPQWQALSRLLLTAGGSLRKRLTVKEGFPAKSAHKELMQAWLDSQEPGAEQWAAALAEVGMLPTQVLSEQQETIIFALLESLKLAAAELMLVFSEEKQVDFIEIAARAAAALGNSEDPSEMLLKLDASIAHILIDEFQDTSQIQIQLVEKLTQGWGEGDGRTLFLVGDPMQSIYRFRKADVGLFLAVARQGLQGLSLRKLTLTENFRSQAGVVDWVNASFEAIFPKVDDPALGGIRYTRSVAFNPVLNGQAIAFHPVYLHDGRDAKQAQREAESLTLNLVREALHRQAGALHPVAILVKARSHLGELVSLLQREGIPVRAVELNPIQAQQSVMDLVQLIRALSHPGDRVAWLSVLRSPVCGLTLAALTHLFGNNRDTVPARLKQVLADEATFGPLLGDEWARLAHCASILLDRRFNTDEVTFASHAESVWRALGGYGVYPTDTAFEDFQAVFEMLERLAPYGGLNPADLEDALGRLYSAASAQTAAVEIMTMHKSKGLEFEEVILYGLHRKPRPESAPLLRFERAQGRLLMGPIKPKAAEETDKLSAMLGAMEKRRGEYEQDRLLYVAATRARKQLHLVAQVSCSNGQPDEAPRGSLLARLLPLFGLTPPAAPPAGTDPVVDTVASVQGPPLVRISGEGLAALPVFSPGTAPVNLAADGWRFDDKFEASIGTVVHAWLARIGKDRLVGWDAESMLRARQVMSRQLESAGLNVEQARTGAQRVYELVARCMASEKGRWLLSHEQARREWELTGPDGQLLIIDAAISLDDRWLVVDFKTGMKGENEPQAAFEARLRQQYREQLRAYCERVSLLDGRPAEAAIFALDTGDWIAMGE